MTQTHKISQLLLLFALVLNCIGKIHRLKVENDDRKKIDLTTFGFLKGGELTINITNFHSALQTPGNVDPKTSLNSFGFTLDKTSNSGISPDLESKSCVLSDEKFQSDNPEDSVSIVFFRLDLNSRPPCIKVKRQGDLKKLKILVPSETKTEAAHSRRRRSLSFLSDSYLFSRKRRAVVHKVKRAVNEIQATTTTTTKAVPKTTKNAASTTTTTPQPAAGNKLPTKSTTKQQSGKTTTAKLAAASTTTTTTISPAVYESVEYINDTIPLSWNPETKKYSAFFRVKITGSEEGLYNLFFHNCDNYDTVKNNQHKLVNFTVYLSESNNYGKNYDIINYLSAGDIPLPNVYMGYAIVYFGVAIFWFYILKRATDGVFKTHYLMFVFLIVKGMSLFFHAIHFYFIRKEGHNEEAFAILYYITYLMKGTLLFVTIVLIGAGWAFVKHILSDRDKKIFIIVIPLQILANVAQIIIEETEEGQSQYLLWKQLFIMLDLLCCGAILFPVVWSIRHLQDASQTDGKAAINLVKLKIFRHFYILIVCYIYFTRIIVYLLAMTVPFQYGWVCTVFKETAALIFFVVTGYKFRPASDNPYLQIPQSDDEVEMEEVLTERGMTEGLIRVNIKDPSNSTAKTVKQRESSHEYD